MTNISIYNNGAGLETINWPLQSSQTVTTRAIGTPTRLRTILKLGKSGTPGTTYSRVHSRPTAGSRTSSTTTMDLATRTYNKVPPIIRTGAVKTAQDRVCRTQCGQTGGKR